MFYINTKCRLEHFCQGFSWKFGVLAILPAICTSSWVLCHIFLFHFDMCFCCSMCSCLRPSPDMSLPVIVVPPPHFSCCHLFPIVSLVVYNWSVYSLWILLVLCQFVAHYVLIIPVFLIPCLPLCLVTCTLFLLARSSVPFLLSVPAHVIDSGLVCSLHSILPAWFCCIPLCT